MSTTQEGSADSAEESGEEFTVEKILATRRRHGKRQFLIRWKGYGPEEDTWEPEENCDCTELIEEFLAEQRAAGKKASAGGRASQQRGKSQQSQDSHQSQEQQQLPVSAAAASSAHTAAAPAAGTPTAVNAEQPSQPEGFERGLEPERIVGAAKKDGRLFLQVRWRNSDAVDLVPASQANERCPDLVIAFYQASVSWYHDDDEEAPI